MKKKSQAYVSAMLVFGVLLGLGFVFYNYSFHKGGLERWLVGYASRLSGYQIVYDNMRLSSYGMLRIEGLKATSPSIRIRVHHINLHVPWRSVFRGWQAFVSAARIDIHGLIAEIDQTVLFAPESATPMVFPKTIPIIHLEDTQVEMLFGPERIPITFHANYQQGVLETVNFRAEYASNTIALQRIVLELFAENGELQKPFKMIREAFFEIHADHLSEIASWIPEKNRFLIQIMKQCHIRGNWQQGVLLIDELELLLHDAMVAVEALTLDISDLEFLGNLPGSKGRITFAIQDVETLGNALGMPGLKGSLFLNAQRKSSERGRFTVTGRGLSWRDYNLGIVDSNGWWDEKKIQWVSFDVRGELGQMTASGSYQFAGGQTEAGISYGTEKLSELLGGKIPGLKKIQGSLTAKSSIRGIAPNYTIQAEMNWQNVTENEPVSEALNVVVTKTGSSEISIEAIGKLTEGELRVSGKIPWQNKALFIDRDKSMSVNAVLEMRRSHQMNALFPWLEKISGSLSGELAVSGTLRKPRIRTLLFGDVSGLEGFAGAGLGLPLKYDCLVKANEKKITLEKMLVSNENSTLEVNASVWGRQAWTNGQTLPMWLEGARIESEMAVRLPGIIWSGTKTGSIDHASGSVEADFQLKGKLENPTLTGRATIDKGTVRLKNTMLPVLQDITAVFRATGNRLVLESLAGYSGGALFNMVGEAGWGKKGAVFVEGRMQGQNLLVLRDESVRLRVDADLALSGDLSEMLLQGSCMINNGLYTKDVDVTQYLQGKGNSALPIEPTLSGGGKRKGPQIKCRIDMGTREPFRIKTNLLQATFSPELQLTGTLDEPVLIGNVYGENVRVVLPAGILNAERGLVRFDGIRPVMPLLDIQMDGRMRGYDVSVQAMGKLQDLKLTLSSRPVLPKTDLLVLLLAGTQPGKKTFDGFSAKGSLKLATYVSRELIHAWSGPNRSQTDHWAERFSLEVGRNVSKTGEETIEAQFQLADNIVSQRDKLILTSERDVHNDFNGGVRIVFQFK